ncbi:MAG: hypothetical protein DIU71_08075 [Proteobacteria bacterium]|nr:MAG: hypothetical protein DIU71_08075 [Pseudomonadota bacterium]
MSEHKSEDFMSGALATGAHRAWAGEAGGILRSGAGARDPSRSWLERPQPLNSRHAAITRSLYSWNSYKSWSDKVRSSWGKDDEEK